MICKNSPETIIEVFYSKIHDILNPILDFNLTSIDLLDTNPPQSHTK